MTEWEDFILQMVLKNKSYRRICRMHLVPLYRRTLDLCVLNMSDIPSQGHEDRNQPTIWKQNMQFISNLTT